MLVLQLVLSSVVLTAAPDAGDKPSLDEQTRSAVQRSLVFLDKGAESWRTERKCVTCHRIAMDIWANNDAKAHGLTIEAAKLQDLTSWAVNFCNTDKSKEQLTGGFLHTMNQMILGQRAAPQDPKATQLFEFFVPIYARVQREDGSWKEGNQIKFQEAQREADEVDTMWTLLALKSLSTIEHSFSAENRAALEKCRAAGLAWLQTAKPETRTDWVALRMLVARAYEDSKDVAQLRQSLLDLQNEDGGWAFVKAGASHVHTTGECMYALAEIGEQRTHPALEKARKYLLATQTENGSWAVSSRRNPAKTYDISNFWGTSWAAIGLLRTLP